MRQLLIEFVGIYPKNLSKTTAKTIPGKGSDASAAGGRVSELSEWQRSTDAKALRRRRQMSGTATGQAVTTSRSLGANWVRRLLVMILTPISALFSGISKLLSRFLTAEQEQTVTEEDLINIIETIEDEGVLEPVFIPKSMKLHAIMNEFRKNRTHMAVVADEYGGITGIVTMEDVLEQLVGEIWDENDDIVNDWQELSKSRFECAGDLNLSELCGYLDLDDEDLDTVCATVGGWATEQIGAMPVPFDAFDFDRFTIMVKEVDENHRITRLLILRHYTEEEE